MRTIKTACVPFSFYMPYFLPYVLLVCLYALLGYLRHRLPDEQQKYYIDLASLAVFVVFFGLRGYLFTDWMSYYPYYANLEWGDVFNYVLPDKEGLEPGFAVLSMVCKTVSGGNYIFLQFVVTCIVLACIFRFMRRYTDNVALSLMLMLTFGGIGIVCNLLRNSLAICIFLLAIPYMEQHRPLQYYLVCLLALTFHISALLYFPLYFFFHRFFNRWIYLAVFVVINVAFITRFSIIDQMLELMGLSGDAAVKADVYTGRTVGSLSVFTLGYMERLLTGLLIIAYHDKMKELHGGSGVVVNGVFMYIAVYFFFSQYEVLANRFSFLFSFGYWIVWLDLMRCFYYTDNRRLLMAFAVVYALLRTHSLNNTPDHYYENVLTGAQSYNERLYYHSRNFHEQ